MKQGLGRKDAGGREDGRTRTQGHAEPSYIYEGDGKQVESIRTQAGEARGKSRTPETEKRYLSK